MRRRDLLATTLGFVTLTGCIQGESTTDQGPTPVPVRHTSTAGPPEVEWQRDYGAKGKPSTHTPNGSPALYANAVERAGGGGFVVAGENFGRGIDAYAQWLDADGRTTRIHTFGREHVNTRNVYQGDGINRANGVARTSQGGVVVAGTQARSQPTDSHDEVVGPMGWAAELTAEGQVPWSFAPDGQPRGSFESAASTGDGRTALAGRRSTDQGLAGWLVVLDDGGSVTTETTLQSGVPERGQVAEGFRSVTRTGDDGFLLTGKHASGGWLVKTDDSGTTQWEHRFDGHSVILMDAVETPDGTYLVTGRRTNPDQQATYSITKSGTHPSDLVVRQVSADGDLGWTRTVDAGGNEIGTAITATADGGVLAAGTHRLNDREGVVAAKLDASGRPQWTETYLVDASISGTDVVQAPDGGFVVTARELTVKLAGTGTASTDTGRATGSETDSAAESTPATGSTTATGSEPATESTRATGSTTSNRTGTEEADPYA
jgi:hypothetical protein